jgi:hypothetical protein
MLMLCEFPFRDNETLSKISGASLAIGAKKNANSTGLTFSSAAASTTVLMNGDENIMINSPPTTKYDTPFTTLSSSSSSSFDSSESVC